MKRDLTPHAARWKGDRYNLAVMTAFFVCLLLFGGASRVDVIGQGIVRIISVVVLISSLFQFDRTAIERVGTVWLFLGALAALIAVQLIPLPPSIWTSLPGRGVFQDALSSLGLDGLWRPASITPDRTLNSLLALLPAAAAVSVSALLSPAAQRHLVGLLLFAIAFSIFLGILQISSGGPYLYSITNAGSAVGSFANRNHSALFVALSLPLLAGWLSLREGAQASDSVRMWLAACAAIAVFPILLVTGSRGGLLLGVAGAAAGIAIVVKLRLRLSRQGGLVVGIAVAIALAIMLLFALSSRDEALQRIINAGEPDLRSNLLPLFVKMAKDYFPFGSGFGSFEYVYRLYEPREFLEPSYLNQAHNDWFQMVIEGGLPAIALLVTFGVWAVRRSFATWREKGESALLGRIGSSGIAMIAIGSAFDYPLRTPLMAVTASIMATWLVASRGDVRAKHPARESLGKVA